MWKEPFNCDLLELLVDVDKKGSSLAWLVLWYRAALALRTRQWPGNSRNLIRVPGQGLGIGRWVCSFLTWPVGYRWPAG